MNLLKGIGVYLTSDILNALIPFLLLPILTRNLSVADYGQVVMFQTLLSAISAIVGLNTIGAANRKYYDGNVDQLVLMRFNGSCFQILLVSFWMGIVCDTGRLIFIYNKYEIRPVADQE